MSNAFLPLFRYPGCLSLRASRLAAQLETRKCSRFFSIAIGYPRTGSPAKAEYSRHAVPSRSRCFTTTSSFQKRSTRSTTGARAPPTADEPRVRIPFGAQSREGLAGIFGQDDIAYETGNKILRILHQRRVVGSLVDKGVQIAGNHNVKAESLQKALAWLRGSYPVDEQAAAELWAEEEAERLEGTYIARAEKLGLYKPLAGEEQQQEISTKSVYGVSVIDEFKKFHEERRAREAKEKEESGETQRNETLAMAKRDEKEQKQMVLEEKWNARRERRALMGMITPEEKPMPEMKAASRVWPSTIAGLSIIAFVWLAGTTYAPPSQEQRLFPETPTAVATIGTIFAINVAIWAVWHVPIAWRQLNKYMVQAASFPFWPSVFGNIWSHQNLPHLGANMLVMFGYGLTLHEDIGRGNFMALYITGGVLGSLFSLWYHVFTKNLIYYSFGASGCAWAVMVGWGVLNISKPMAHSDSWHFGADVARWAIIVFQFLSHFAPGIATRIDIWAHLGGAMSGGVSAWYLKSKAMLRREEDVVKASQDDSAGTALGFAGRKAG
jgi:rhomboid-like protein